MVELVPRERLYCFLTLQHPQATLYDHLFLLNHIMRCPAGVGRWAAGYIQPALPVTDLLETSFDNPFLDHLITILATVLLPVKERAAFVQEHRLKARYVKDGGEEEGDRVWCVLDGEGSEEEDMQVGIFSRPGRSKGLLYKHLLLGCY